MREEALAALRGSDLIIHAGDVGSPDVLERLREIAPVHAVRGNNDRDVWARALPLTDVVELGRYQVYLLHDLSDLDVDPAAAGFAAVITGAATASSIAALMVQRPSPESSTNPE